jgi:transcriptional regulator with XRE-family HTH domain
MRNEYIETSETTIKTPYPRFADRLDYAMHLRDFNNLRLARSIYVSPSAISAYRNGTRQPNFEVLRSISLALDVSADFLLGLSEYPDKTFTPQQK